MSFTITVPHKRARNTLKLAQAMGIALHPSRMICKKHKRNRKRDKEQLKKEYRDM